MQLTQMFKPTVVRISLGYVGAHARARIKLLGNAHDKHAACVSIQGYHIKGIMAV